MLLVASGLCLLVMVALLSFGGDGLAVTPTSTPTERVELVEGPRSGCGRRNAVWDAVGQDGEQMTICDHTGSRTGTAHQLGDIVEIGRPTWPQRINDMLMLVVAFGGFAFVFWMGGSHLRGTAGPSDGRRFTLTRKTSR